MAALDSVGGKEVARLDNAKLDVNGMIRDLRTGFPFNGRPEKLFIRHPKNVLQLGYLSPENRLFEASLQLDNPTLIRQSFTASATDGLEVTITPALRANEIVDVTLYRSTSQAAVLVTSKSFQGAGVTRLVIDPSQFMPSIGSSTEIIVEISRTLTDNYRALFSRGIELSQHVGSHTQYVTVAR